MKRENFKLKKVKVEKNLVTIDYSIDGSDKEFTEKCKTSPHPDLYKALGVFKPLMVQVCDMPEENDEKFAINGIVITEKKGTEFVMILSSYTVESGSKIAINSPLISMDTDYWQDQEKLGENSDMVVDECFEYLFKNKAAQLQIILEEDKEEEPVEEKE